MDTRMIGTLPVSVIGIGCNNIGRGVDQAGATEIVNAALDAGITYFDTADVYGRPRTLSETFLGVALEGRRDDAVIGTKFGAEIDPEHRGAAPAYVRSACDASLMRLRTDRIDLFQLHYPQQDNPIEETLGVLAELVEEGKVLEIGCSNFSADQVRAAHAAARPGRPGFASLQSEYNLLSRTAEAALLPACRASRTGFVPFYPLASGMLTGKYRRQEPAAVGSRLSSGYYDADALLTDANFDIVEALARFCGERGRSLLELAFGWLLGHAEIPTVIAGVSSADQVLANAASTGWVLTANEMAEVDRLTSPAA